MQAETLLPLKQIKQHLRIDHHAEDELIIIFRAAALERVETFLGLRLVADVFHLNGSHEMVINDSVRAACLLLIGHLYYAREGGTPSRSDELPQGIYALLMPYRSYLGVGVV